jgi:hypothetical protein
MTPIAVVRGLVPTLRPLGRNGAELVSVAATLRNPPLAREVKAAALSTPISRASPTGRCNTIYSVDPTKLPPREPICPTVLNQM